jgi:heme O synthase-like polyprenyltransferase
MSRFTEPVEKIRDAAKDYVDMRVDMVKLRTVKGLSVAANHILSMSLLLILGSLFMLALAFGSVLWLGSAIGSYAGGAFIVAAFFLVLAVLVFIFRKKLFLNSFVRLFTSIFFDDSDNKEDAE